MAREEDDFSPDHKAEFEEHEDAYADHMQDEWEKRHRFERDADRSVSELFSSLRGDRD